LLSERLLTGKDDQKTHEWGQLARHHPAGTSNNHCRETIKGVVGIKENDHWLRHDKNRWQTFEGLGN
jgi:hypothetical protein